jgi:biopolymer transport protein ExbD
MAEIADSGGGDHKGKKRAKKSSTRVDMTPMVDLAFLLLTFFVLTSTFSKSKVMSLVYPAKQDKPDPNPPKIFNAVTFLVSEDHLFYYYGEFFGPSTPNPKGEPLTTLSETNFGPDGVRKMLAEKNAYVTDRKRVLDVELQKGQLADTTYKRLLSKAKTDKDALKVLIKTDEKATCKNFVDLIDELKIANVGVIAPVDLTKDEEALMKAKE